MSPPASTASRYFLLAHRSRFSVWTPVSEHGRDAIATRVQLVAQQLPDAPSSGTSHALVACCDRLSFVVASLAAWVRGYSIALPPNLRPRTLGALANGHPLVLHDGILEGGLDVSTIDLRAPAPALEAVGIDADRELACVYTSGSTAAPKPVPKSARQLIAEAGALIETFGLGPHSRMVATVPPYHIYGLLFGVLVPLVCGGTIASPAPLHPPAVAAAIDGARANILISTPAHLRGLEVLDRGACPTLTTIFSSGAPLLGHTRGEIRERFGITVTEVLGSTETGGIGWRRVEHGDEGWTPLAGVTVAADRSGRLSLQSPFLAEKGPCAAQDRVELLADGRFLHLGRLDDVVKVGGKRVSTSALEARLLEIAGVDDAVVIAEPAAERGTRLKAIVVAPRVTDKALREQLLGWFDATVVPRMFVRVDSIPREASGKVMRDRLSALLSAAAAAGRTIAIRPRDEGTPSEPSFDVHIPDGLVFFEGHFPDSPVLPGAVQLDRIVLQQIEAVWPELDAPVALHRIKFHRPIAPQTTLALHLLRKRSQVQFRLESDSGLNASGAFEFKD